MALLPSPQALPYSESEVALAAEWAPPTQPVVSLVPPPPSSTLRSTLSWVPHC